MSMMVDVVVSKVLTTIPTLYLNRYWVAVEYTYMHMKSETTMMFRTKNEALAIKVGDIFDI